MLRLHQIKYLFSTAPRIDFKNFLKTHEYLSSPRPEVIYQENEEYFQYRKKIKEEINIDELLKNDNRAFNHGNQPQRRLDNVYSFICLSNDTNPILFGPDGKWSFEEYFLRYCDVPVKLMELADQADGIAQDEKSQAKQKKLTTIEEDLKKQSNFNYLNKKTIEDAIDVLQKKFAEKNIDGAAFNIENEVRTLLAMDDKAFNKKFKKNK